MTANEMNIKMFRAAIEDTNGRFFTIIFDKSDGTERRMTARIGVKKHLKGLFTGNDRAPSTNDDIVTLWDTGVQEYRSVKLSKIKEFRCGGKRFYKAVPLSSYLAA